MKKLSKNKIVIAVTSAVLVVMLVATGIMMTADKPPVPADRQDKTPGTSDVNVQFPSPAETEQSGTDNTSGETGTDITVEVGADKTPGSTSKPDTPTAQGDVKTDTKTPPKTDDTVLPGTGTGTGNNPDKTSSNPPDGVVGVEPVERGDEPDGASGVKPKDSDWVSVSGNVPQELYEYDYTVMDGNDIITGAQMKWRGYNTWDKAANAAVGGLKQYYSIDYRKIQSVNPNDRDKYLTDLVYWTGESAHIDICDYMQFTIDNKIISTASVVTDGSLMYNNGVQLIRARVYVTFESGASAYGLQNGIKYYRDVEVAVYAATGEDRYGFGKCNDFNVLLFSEGCFNFLCPWKKA